MAPRSVEDLLGMDPENVTYGVQSNEHGILLLDIDSNKLQECVVPYTPNHGYSAVAVEVFVDYRNYRTAVHASSPLE